jgi:hypothetical protein
MAVAWIHNAGLAEVLSRDKYARIYFDVTASTLSVIAITSRDVAFHFHHHCNKLHFAGTCH